MASIRIRGKKKMYYALFRDESGKQIERPCKTTDKKTAQEIADNLEKASRPTQNKVTAEKMRRNLAEVHKKLLGEDLPQMTVKGYLTYWRETRKNEVSEDTYDFHKQLEARLLFYLGDRANEDLFMVQKNDIVRLRDEERKRVSAKRTNNILKGVRMIFKQALEDGWIIENPAATVKLVKADPSEKVPKKPFTLEQLQKILEHCDEEWKQMVVRGYYTGQRLLDIAMMTGECENPHLGQVFFWTNKTTVRVITEMHPAYVQFVLNQKSSDDPSLPLHPRARALVMKRKKNRTSTISNQFTKILADAGFRTPRSHKALENGPGRSGKRKKEPYSFHSLRHSMVTHLAAAGVSRSVVQDIVGHESAEVNAQYTHMDSKTKRDAMAKLPDIIKS